MRNTLINNYQCKPNLVSVVNNWSLYEPPLTRPNCNVINASDISFTLFGNIGPFHLSNDLINLLDNLASTTPSSPIDLFIRGRYAARLLSSFCNHPSIKLHPIVKPSSLYQKLSASSVAIVSLTYNASFFAFPSRISTALSFGFPILFLTDRVEGNPISRFIAHHQIGISVLTTDVSEDSVLEHVNTLLSHFTSYRSNCLSTYDSMFSKSRCLDKLSHLILG